MDEDRIELTYDKIYKIKKNGRIMNILHWRDIKHSDGTLTHFGFLFSLKRKEITRTKQGNGYVVQFFEKDIIKIIDR